MKIAMANDHAGYALKEEIKKYLEIQWHKVIDFGTNSEEACDLSDYIYEASMAVASVKLTEGFLLME